MHNARISETVYKMLNMKLSESLRNYFGPSRLFKVEVFTVSQIYSPHNTKILMQVWPRPKITNPDGNLMNV